MRRPLRFTLGLGAGAVGIAVLLAALISAPSGVSSIGEPEIRVAGGALTYSRICSKTAGGRYAMDTFDPRWHRIMDEYLRSRTGRARRLRYRDLVRGRRDALAFVGMVINGNSRRAP